MSFALTARTLFGILPLLRRFRFFRLQIFLQIDPLLVCFNNDEKRVIHQVVTTQESDVTVNLLHDRFSVFVLKQQENVVLLDILQVLVLKSTALRNMTFPDISIND